MDLVVPGVEHLDSFAAALRRGWSPDSSRPNAGAELLVELESDPDGVLASMDDPQARGPVVTLPDGSTVERLPSITRWMWDGEFCGSIGLRWADGTTDLPPTCLGHIGYSVVPWKQRRGYATAALAAMLPQARALGLPFVEITTDESTLISQRVIKANGGVELERFTKLPANGGGPGIRWRIELRAA
jgi:predicted acetyltransferase